MTGSIPVAATGFGRGYRPGAVIRPIGGFFAMCLDTFVLMFRPPWAWREFLFQMWFAARVSFLPTVLMAIPLVVLSAYVLNILLIEFGAADLSGTGVALGAVTQGGPIVTVLVISGAAATAMCADLGSRAIREELDALRVLGINPVQALVVPRVAALTLVATLLASVVTMVGIIAAYFFSVFVQHITPGAFVAGLPLLVGTPEVVICLSKAAVFGLAGSLIACYKGMSVGGGPAGVGNAVNETVVYTFLALFALNVVITAVGVKATL
ncbi:ABC transporter permease [Mycolicibacterium hippocampi]|uniref:ABC transporter permease n=2 Tax=Mycolicibacterium hippocampi TaxID=659824 RepID=A0A7I9ZG81_9MYCO|nr:ABC transporter permease [Mycolicibacterium hippocampi]